MDISRYPIYEAYPPGISMSLPRLGNEASRSVNVYTWELVHLPTSTIMFFFDTKLQLYINDTPLLISSRVLKAARAVDVDLQWNEEGYVCAVSHEVAQAMSKALGIIALSVAEFMDLAKREPRVASVNFAEWFADRYTLTEDSQILDSNGQIVAITPARPGWFVLDDIDHRGLPNKIFKSSSLGLWKFWTPDHCGLTFGGLRSFVTSSGTCSLDMGIPVFAKHRMIMIRECYRSMPPETKSPLESIWSTYQSLTRQRGDKAIRSFITALKLDNVSPADHIDGFLVEREREMISDLTGKKRLLTGEYNGLKLIDTSTICKALSAVADEDTTFVTGHMNPDADSIVASVFEATRRSLIHGGRKCLAWTEQLPHEVEYVLGAEISDCVVKTPKFGTQNDIVLVDCHSIDLTYQHQVKSIIDHHIIREKFAYYVAMSQEVSWSSTIQVYIKILGSGWDLATDAARILAEATKLEAEPLLMRDMSEIDQLAMQRLEKLAGPTTTYEELMGVMTNCQNLEETFYKDYKERSFGFTVIKTRTPQSLDEFARRNNSKRHLPLTVVKQVVYDNSFDNVLTETIYMLFNDDSHDKGFRNAVKRVIEEACGAFHGKNFVIAEGNLVTIRNAQTQTPRLLLKDIVEEHLRFFYSKTVDKYISCGFFTKSTQKHASAPGKVYPQANISFHEVKALLKGSNNTSFLSLPQYWRVYKELKARNDVYSLKSMQDKTYVELLDTVLYACSEVSNCGGDVTRLKIQEAKPGLISPADGSVETGLPVKIVGPDNYDRSLWRYWSPDAEVNVATRGHIFVMDQTCIDLKIGPSDKTKRLTFRPVYRDIPDIQYELGRDGAKWVELKVFPRLFSISDI